MLKLFSRKKPLAIKKRVKQRGVALAIVSLSLLLLTILILSSYYLTVAGVATTSSYRTSTQAFYVAEAGIQRSIQWFSYYYTPQNWPTLGENTYPSNINSTACTMGISGNPVILSTMVGVGNVPTAAAPAPNPTGSAPFANYGEILSGKSYSFKDYLANATVQPIAFPGPATNPQGSYNVTATLLSTKQIASFSGGPPQLAERWRLDSIGTLKTPTGATIATAENVAVIETLVTPLITHAICANSMSTTGTYKAIDSYDSSTDPNATQSGPTSIGSYAGSSGSFAGLGGGCSCNVSSVDLSTASETASGGAGGAVCGSATNGCDNTNLCPTLPPVPATCTSAADGWTPAHPGFTNGPFTATPTPATGSCPLVASFNRGNFTGGAGVKVVAPVGACGDVSFWFGNLTGPIIFDNATNRTGAGSCAGAMNIYINQYLGGGIQVRGSYNSPVRLYMADTPAQSTTDMDGVNTTPVAPDVNTYPGNLVIMLSNPATTLFIKGSEAFSAVIYGPTANVDFQDNGGNGFRGAIFANNFSRKGIVHYDRNLLNAYGSTANFVVQTEVKRVY